MEELVVRVVHEVQRGAEVGHDGGLDQPLRGLARQLLRELAGVAHNLLTGGSTTRGSEKGEGEEGRTARLELDSLDMRIQPYSLSPLAADARYRGNSYIKRETVTYLLGLDLGAHDDAHGLQHLEGRRVRHEGIGL